MLSTITVKKSWPARNAATLLALTVATFLGSSSARAVTCEDVRSLSSEEQDYWSKRLNLSSEQRHKIWVTCYRDYHPKPQEIVRR